MLRFLMVGIVSIALVPAAFAGYPDVGSDHWAYDAVAKVQQLGLMTARSDGQFHGDKPPTRYEMALALARVMAEVDNRMMAKTSNPEELVPYIERINLVVADEIDKLKQSQRDVRAQVKAVEDRVCMLSHENVGAPPGAPAPVVPAAPKKHIIEGALPHAYTSAPVVAAVHVGESAAGGAAAPTVQERAGADQAALPAPIELPAPLTAGAVAGAAPIPVYDMPSEGERESIIAAPSVPDPYSTDKTAPPRDQPAAAERPTKRGSHHGSHSHHGARKKEQSQVVPAAAPAGEAAAPETALQAAGGVSAESTPAQVPVYGTAVAPVSPTETIPISQAVAPGPAPVQAQPVAATVPAQAAAPVAVEAPAATAAGVAATPASLQGTVQASAATQPTAGQPAPAAAAPGGPTASDADEEEAPSKPISPAEALQWLQISPSAKALVEKLRAERSPIK